MEYVIEFDHWEPLYRNVTGLKASDWLPGYQNKTFDTPNEAHTYLAKYHLGEDENGINAVFNVEEKPYNANY